MFQMESVLVNEEFVQDEGTYNIKLGGEGGWDYINSLERTGSWLEKTRKQALLNLENGRKTQKWLLENDKEWAEYYRKIRSDDKIRFYNNGGIGGFTNKKHSEETKEKIGLKNSISQTGKGNSQFGKMWIYNTNLKENKRILKTEEIPEGWIKGRKIKI